MHLWIAAFALIAAFSLASVAHADAQVSIAGTGQVIVRGAKVISVSGSTLSVSTGWGATAIQWTIRTNGSTKFYPSGTSTDILRSIKAGDLLSFSGELDANGRFVVNATAVKDSMLLKEAHVIEGTVASIGENTLTLSSEEGTSTVSVYSSTIITLDGDTASLEDLQVGDTVKVQGTYNTVAKSMSADRVSFFTPEIPNTGSAQDQNTGFFRSILAWFMNTRGALSTR